jgi:hypothetical protein
MISTTPKNLMIMAADRNAEGNSAEMQWYMDKK